MMILSEKPICFPNPKTFHLTDSDITEYLSTKQLIFRQQQANMLGIERTANMTAKRVATYLRVSTKNHGQNLDTQRLALEEYARNRGFEIVEEYADHGFSGSKDRRPALDRLMRDARARKFDGILVARFDRFARSTKHLVTALEEFG